MFDRTHNSDVDKIVSQVLADLDGSVSEAFVYQTVATLFADYVNAPVKLFVPILVRREALDLLRRAPMEIEAKFVIPDPAVYWRLQTAMHLAGYALSTQKVLDIRDTYLDTSKRHILTAGYSCRRRRLPEGIVMTLKSLGRADGAIHRRQEFETTLPTALPPAEWPDSEMRERVLQLSKRESISPLFELEQTRLIRIVQQDEQPLAELSLDRVSLMSGGKELVYHELEIELLPSGSEQNLKAIVDCLHGEWHLHAESLSKFERALALVDAQMADDNQSRQKSRRNGHKLVLAQGLT